MIVKIKKLSPDTVLPTRAQSGDVGWDLYATKNHYIHMGDTHLVETGISIQPAAGYFSLVVPRSSIAKTSLIQHNSVGVIDPGYSGEILVPMRGIGVSYSIRKGDRIAQLIVLPYPEVEWEEVEQLEKTERSTAGFGSSGQ